MAKDLNQAITDRNACLHVSLTAVKGLDHSVKGLDHSVKGLDHSFNGATCIHSVVDLALIPNCPLSKMASPKASVVFAVIGPPPRAQWKQLHCIMEGIKEDPANVYKLMMKRLWGSKRTDGSGQRAFHENDVIDFVFWWNGNLNLAMCQEIAAGVSLFLSTFALTRGETRSGEKGRIPSEATVLKVRKFFVDENMKLQLKALELEARLESTAKASEVQELTAKLKAMEQVRKNTGFTVTARISVVVFVLLSTR
jgi:hypothetical protein